MRPPRGFTLLEVMVVMALMAFALGVVVPRLDVFKGSMAAAHERETLIEAVASLGLVARQNGQLIEFSGEPAWLPGDLPTDWTILVDEPIHFYPSGACTGGIVTLQHGKRQFVYSLSPPRCRATLVD